MFRAGRVRKKVEKGTATDDDRAFLVDYQKRVTKRGRKAKIRINDSAPKQRKPSLVELARESVQIRNPTNDSATSGRCPQCSAPIDDTTKFCRRCGANLLVNDCPECGAPLDGHPFCGNCGSSSSPESAGSSSSPESAGSSSSPESAG